MTNWRTYTIQNKELNSMSSNSEWVMFYLDGYVNFNGETTDFIYCKNQSPFNSWDVGYQIEIDNDRTKVRGRTQDIDSTTIVRLSSNSLSLARDNNMLNEMRRTVERDKNMYLEFIEENGVKPDGTVYRMQGWRYGRK